MNEHVLCTFTFSVTGSVPLNFLTENTMEINCFIKTYLQTTLFIGSLMG